jgi:hypothetical protein
MDNATFRDKIFLASAIIGQLQCKKYEPMPKETFDRLWERNKNCFPDLQDKGDFLYEILRVARVLDHYTKRYERLGYIREERPTTVPSKVDRLFS